MAKAVNAKNWSSLIKSWTDGTKRTWPQSLSVLPNATVGGAYFYKFTPQAAYQPSTFSVSRNSGSNNYFISRQGTLFTAPTIAETATLTVTEVGADGTTYPSTITLTCDNLLRLQGYSWNRTGAQPLAAGNVNTKYQLQLQGAAGGSGTGYTYTVSAGSLPAGLSMSTAGLITGTPTTQGTSTFTVKVTDSTSNTATAQFSIAINALSQVARPAYNTGTGFFVDGNGILRDPNGYQFTIRGLNSLFTEVSWAAGNNATLVRPNAIRIFGLFWAALSQCLTRLANGEFPKMLPIPTCAYYQAGSYGTSGDTNAAHLALACSHWYFNYSNFSTYMNHIAINIANEWGPTNSINWQYAHQYVQSSITGLSGSTITVNSAAGTNPFANTPFAVIKGAGGISDAVVTISATGGISGAWTMTVGDKVVTEKSIGTGNGSSNQTFTVTVDPNVVASTVVIAVPGSPYYWHDDGAGNLVGGNGASGSGTINYTTGAVSLTTGATGAPANLASVNIEYLCAPAFSGYTSGGILYGGSVGVMRAAGYLCPLMIDSGQSGQDEFDFTSYAQAVHNADPQKNCIFSYHLYGVTDDIAVPISGITQANPAVITLNYPYSSPNTHPFSSNYTGVAPNNNHYFGKGPLNAVDVQGMTQINGSVPLNSNPQALGGIQDASPWTMTTNVNSTGYSAYTSAGTLYDFGYYAQRIARLAALKSSGICVIVGEFGSGQNQGASATWVDFEEVVSTCEANGIGWIPWAWDGSANDQMTSNTNGSWNGAPTNLTYFGLYAAMNPDYGLVNTATPAAYFLP